MPIPNTVSGTIGTIARYRATYESRRSGIGVHRVGFQQFFGFFQVGEDTFAALFHCQERMYFGGQFANVRDALVVGVHRTRFAEKAQEIEVQECPQPQCLTLEDGVVVTAEHVLLSSMHASSELRLAMVL